MHSIVGYLGKDYFKTLCLRIWQGIFQWLRRERGGRGEVGGGG